MWHPRLLISAGLTLVLLWSSAEPGLAQPPPIKIGVMFPLTGPLTSQGLPERDAVKQAFDEENYQVAGRKIELIIEDSQGKPDIGLTKARKLVESDRVHLLLAELVSVVGNAMAPYVNAERIPWVNTVALAALTRSQKSPYIFRFVPSSYQFGLTGAQWVKKQGWKKVYFFAWDAPPSREAVQAAKKILGEDNVEATFSPVGTADYGPYLAKVDPKKADGVLAAMWGADSSRITRQFTEYGLKGRLPFFGIASFTSEEVLPAMPPEAEGLLSAYTYCGTLDTPENKRFVEGYRARYNAWPGSYQYMGYMAAKFVVQALKEIQGRAEDREAFVAALRKIQLRGPMGMASFDERQGMVADFYVLKVVRKDGRLQNECIERIPQVKDPYDLFP